MEKPFRCSPCELFSTPRELLQVMGVDLQKPETEHQFIGDEIPPGGLPQSDEGDEAIPHIRAVLE